MSIRIRTLAWEACLEREWRRALLSVNLCPLSSSPRQHMTDCGAHQSGGLEEARPLIQQPIVSPERLATPQTHQNFGYLLLTGLNVASWMCKVTLPKHLYDCIRWKNKEARLDCGCVTYKWGKRGKTSKVLSNTTDCQRSRRRIPSSQPGLSSTTMCTMSPSFWRRWDPGHGKKIIILYYIVSHRIISCFLVRPVCGFVSVIYGGNTITLKG